MLFGTMKVRPLFPLKDNIDHFSCDQNYIGKRVHNEKTQWNGRKDKNSKSESTKHSKENPTHKFTWTIICKAPGTFYKHRVFKAYFTKTSCPTLNKQLDNDILTLFRNDILNISCNFPLAISLFFYKILQ